MLRTTALLMLAGLMGLSLCAQAEVYRWVDKDGKVQYSDNPPPDAKAEQRKLGDNGVAATGQSYETTRAAQGAPVTLYVYDDCKEPCEQARKLLKSRKVPFSEKSVKTQTDLDAFAALLGKKEPLAPTMIVGRKPLEGFEAGAWNSALDVAGYPKAP